MVIERVKDSEKIVIDVIHIKTKEEIRAIALPEETVHQMELEAVQKELKEDYPEFKQVFAAKSEKYIKSKSLGLFMEYVARGVMWL